MKFKQMYHYYLPYTIKYKRRLSRLICESGESGKTTMSFQRLIMR